MVKVMTGAMMGRESEAAIEEYCTWWHREKTEYLILHETQGKFNSRRNN